MNWLNIDSERNDSVWIHSVGSKIKFIEHCMTLTTLAFLRIPHNTSYITLGREGEIFWLTAIRKFKCLSVLPVLWTTMRTTLRWDFLDNPWERVAKKRVIRCACDRVIATGWHCQLVFDWNLDDVRVIFAPLSSSEKLKKKSRQYTSHYTDKSLATTLQLSKMNFSPFTTSFANVNVNQFAKFTQNLTAPSHHQVSFVDVIVKLQMSQPQTTHKMFSGISQAAAHSAAVRRIELYSNMSCETSELITCSVVEYYYCHLSVAVESQGNSSSAALRWDARSC